MPAMIQTEKIVLPLP